MKTNLSTGVSTFAIRTSQRIDQKLQKSFHLCHPNENFKFFPLALKNKKRNTLPVTDKKSKQTMTLKSITDKGLQGRRTEHQLPTAVLQKWRCSASYDSEVVNQNLCFN